MSRSKEGREEIKTPDESRSTESSLDDRLGARGQTDYTPGRESYRDFPRRSTSKRAREESYYQSRENFDEQSRPGRDRFESGRTEPTFRHARPDRYGRTGDAEPGRYGRKSYSEMSGRQSRYRGEERDYDRSSNYGYDRENYGNPYNREAVSRDYEYDRDYTPSIANAGWGVGRGIDTDQWRDERRERSSRRERNVLRCGDIMTKDVTCCSPQQSIREVADKMEDENVGSIPVLENGRLIGIVTDRDIVCRIVAEGKDTRATTVSEAMSEDLVTCSTDDTVEDAIHKMSQHQIRRLPIVDFNGRLRGIVAMADIALEAERDRDLAKALEDISRPTPNRARRV